MASTVASARIELNKAQVWYKKGFDGRMRRGNAEIKVGDRIWMDVQDGKGNTKLGGHTEGPFLVLDRTTRTFVLQRGTLFKG